MTKTILVTGANRGIGLELTKQYCFAGWRVLACCRQPEKADELKKLENDEKNNLTILPLELTDTSAIKALSQELSNETIDVLINNAAVVGKESSNINHIDPQAWLETFNINTISPFMLSQALIPQITKGQQRVICNISSLLGSIELNDDGNYYAYRSSKAALNAVTKSLAIDLHAKKIIVIALSPGWVKTDMGGVNAPLYPEESVTGIRQVLNSLTLEDSGSFITYDGKRLAW